MGDGQNYTTSEITQLRKLRAKKYKNSWKHSVSKFNILQVIITYCCAVVIIKCNILGLLKMSINDKKERLRLADDAKNNNENESKDDAKDNGGCIDKILNHICRHYNWVIV